MRLAAALISVLLGLVAFAAATHRYDSSRAASGVNVYSYDLASYDVPPIPVPGHQAAGIIGVAGLARSGTSGRASPCLIASVVGAETGGTSAELIGAPAEFNPASLTGETPEAVRARIPDDWVGSPSKSGGGEVFSDPANPGRQIRIMPGYGDGVRPDPLTAGPYAVVSQNGVVIKVPLAGNPTLP